MAHSIASSSNSTHKNPLNTNPISNAFKFVHNFKYNYTTACEISDLNHLANEYERCTHLTPTNFELNKEHNYINVTILSEKDTVHTCSILNDLAAIGLELKLNSNQIDKNSIFCVNGPAELWKAEKDIIISTINSFNEDIFAIDCYIIPPKSIFQKTASFKVTVATQKMASFAISKGFKVLNKYINPTQLTRSKILNTSQCSKCQAFNHGYNGCKNIKNVCPHCSLDHELKNCHNKKKPALCNNCGGSHRTTSNSCPIKQKYLIIPTSFHDKDKINLRINPESSYYNEAPAPTNNPWSAHHSNIPHNSNNPPPPIPPYNQTNFPSLPANRAPLLPTPNFPPNSHHDNSNSTAINQAHPLISYEQCFAMATKFIDWPFAFKELQKAFNISPVISIPSSLHNQLKPDFSSLNPNPHIPSSSSTSTNHTPNFSNSNTITPPTTNTNLANSPSSRTYPQSTVHNFSNKPANSHLNNSSHNIIYSLSPSIKANTIPNNSKNNFTNHKQAPSPNFSISPTSSKPTGAIPKIIMNTQNTPNPKSINITSSPPNSPEADDPSPINQSPISTSSSSDESIDIIGDSELNETIIHNVPPSPREKTSPSPSLPSKLKLINKILTPPNANSDPLSPVERKAMRKVLRSRQKDKSTNLKIINKNIKKLTNNNSSKHD